MLFGLSFSVVGLSLKSCKNSRTVAEQILNLLEGGLAFELSCDMESENDLQEYAKISRVCRDKHGLHCC